MLAKPRQKPRGETVLQRLLKGLNGDAADVRFLMRSGMDFDTAVTKAHEAKSHADSILNKCLEPITAGREPVHKSLPEPDALATISFVVEQF